MRSKSVPLAKDWNTKHFFKRYRIWRGKSPVLHSKGPVQTEVPVARWCRPSCKLQFPETSRWCHQSIKLCNSHPDVAMVPLWNECAPFRIQHMFQPSQTKYVEHFEKNYFIRCCTWVWKYQGSELIILPQPQKQHAFHKLHWKPWLKTLMQWLHSRCQSCIQFHIAKPSPFK
jgi:hypothetical protein